MKTKSVEKNKQDGEMEATVILSNHEIILIKEALNMYEDKKLGDIDDPEINAIKKNLIKELHEAWKTMNPS